VQPVNPIFYDQVDHVIGDGKLLNPAAVIGRKAVDDPVMQQTNDETAKGPAQPGITATEIIRLTPGCSK
jgi:hypothetical protein